MASADQSVPREVDRDHWANMFAHLFQDLSAQDVVRVDVAVLTPREYHGVVEGKLAGNGKFSCAVPLVLLKQGPTDPVNEVDLAVEQTRNIGLLIRREVDGMDGVEEVIRVNLAHAKVECLDCAVNTACQYLMLVHDDF